MNTSDSGIFCPACKMRNEPGAIICVYCKTPLKHNSQKTIVFPRGDENTGTLSDVFEDILSAPAYTPERFMDFEIPTKGITLIHLETSQPLAALNEKTFILGRATEEINTHEPLIDLTEFNALDNGISRVHALSQKTKSGYQIKDLDSTNGTWLENQRLAPQIPTSLQSGDRIRLGRMHILVFYMGL